eukprot:XP_001705200.1 Hypothetical protein GL50803_19324 [Giardia lamblia ATCC 50803]
MKWHRLIVEGIYVWELPETQQRVTCTGDHHVSSTRRKANSGNPASVSCERAKLRTRGDVIDLNRSINAGRGKCGNRRRVACNIINSVNVIVHGSDKRLGKHLLQLGCSESPNKLFFDLEVIVTCGCRPIASAPRTVFSRPYNCPDLCHDLIPP